MIIGILVIEAVKMCLLGILVWNTWPTMTKEEIGGWVAPKEGLKAGWAKFEGLSDFVVGSADSKIDCNLIHYHLASEKLRFKYFSKEYDMEKSLLQELHERGYDLSTLKFSIKKLEK